MLADLLRAHPANEFPVHRADLYRRLLEQDSILGEWLRSGYQGLDVICMMAFRMVDDDRSSVRFDELPAWIRDVHPESDDFMETVLTAVRRSKLFREETTFDTLGARQGILAPQHELIGKYFASRHLRSSIRIGQQQKANGASIHDLACQARFLEVFFFSVDEISSSAELDFLMQQLLTSPNTFHLKIAAYIIATHPTLIGHSLRGRFELEQLEATLRDTPAVIVPSSSGFAG